MSNFFTHAYLMDLKGVKSFTILYSLPYCVQDKKVVLTRTKLGRIIQSANILLSKLTIVLYAIRIIYKFRTSVVTTTQMLLFAGWSTLIGCNFIFRLEHFKKKEETVLLLNRMHFFEKQQIAQGNNALFQYPITKTNREIQRTVNIPIQISLLKQA